MSNSMRMSGRSLSLPGWESTRGENSRTAKLTDADVRAIRESGKTVEQLCKEYPVSMAYMRRVIANQVRRDA